MYDNLINRLQEDKPSRRMMLTAADAIEELCDLCASQSKDYSEAVAKYLELWAKQPRWIPVTERLPEEPGMYIVFLRCGAELQDTGFPEDLSYVTAMHFDSDQRIWNDGIESYNANLDVVNKPHAYYITHWMPLPSTEGLNET